jgi:hypothetical protein
LKKKIYFMKKYLFQVKEVRQAFENFIQGNGRTHGSKVGRGTVLQAGRGQVQFPKWSLDFSFALILPATVWP